MAKLLLIEEEWAAKHKSRADPDSSFGSRSNGRGRYVKKDRSGARAGGEGRDSGTKLTSMGTPRRKGRCRKCNIYGHFVKECKTKPQGEERQEAAHHANADQEGALLEHVFPTEYNEGTWVLDMGAMNHMTGCRALMATLDESVRGAVRFGDGSTMEIHDIGAVAIAEKNNDHRVLTEVYFIPSLKCNIISHGQLEEGGCRVEVDHGVMTVFERRQVDGNKLSVLIRAERKNRLYIMRLNLSGPVADSKNGATEPTSPAASIPLGGGASTASPYTPRSSVGSIPQIQWATPPSDASEGTDEAPRRYRTLPNLFDSTDEV
ncbi:unnamed protein product [Miscanthus lutarioriparius]|uniref:Retrovirus-related Pol polyprotein from transposon TNT 1-94-like beta-barrel domain-containing protein n=1 Tax=Miscanthus lutarioriparius TaxID=422564 RepID=A0A811SB41_9POAL|nr:unnamed protein product [Miscanthus lutarioriparius]